MTFSLLLSNLVLEPPVPVWAYQADKSLCLLPRELWSSQALRALERMESALRSYLPFTQQYRARAKASQDVFSVSAWVSAALIRPAACQEAPDQRKQLMVMGRMIDVLLLLVSSLWTWMEIPHVGPV
ncbi:hypothetical protein PAMP_010073 [Pampus punctatissimus]